MKELFRQILLKLQSGLLRRTFVYTASASLNALVAFLLLPVLTKYLTPYDYGVVETFLAATACLTGLIMFGGNTLLSKEYFGFSEEERSHYISNILGVACISCLVLSVGFIVFSRFSDLFLNLLKISNGLILLIIVMAFANAVAAMLLTLFQLEKKTRPFALLSNARSIIEILISLFCVVVLGMNWQGRILGVLVTGFLSTLAVLFIFRKKRISITFPARYGKHILLAGAPLLVAHFTGWINEMVDKIMITNILDAESTGIYSIGYRFGMVVMMVETAFSLAWLPFFYENIRKNSIVNDLRIVKATYLYIALLFLFAVCFGLGGKYLLFAMVDEKFYAASQFVFLVSMAYCFSGIWKSFTGYLIYKGRMKAYSNIVLAAAVVNIVLNYVLLKKIGLIGSAWATFISLALGALLTVIMGTRCHPMPWSLRADNPLGR